MRIVDGHAHVCGKNFNSERLKAYLEENKIERVVLCGSQPEHKKSSKYRMLSRWLRGERCAYTLNKLVARISKGYHQLSEHLEAENKKVHEIARKLPEQVIATYWVNPLEENCLERLDYYYNNYPFKVIKLHQCWTHFDLEDECVLAILQWARIHECLVFIHLFSQEQVKKFVKVANRFQDVKFIMAHLIGAKEMIGQLKSRNVYFDLSAPWLYSLDTLRQVLDHFGAARLIVGSDTTYGKTNIEEVVERLKEASVAEVELNYICRKNLLRVLERN